MFEYVDWQGIFNAVVVALLLVLSYIVHTHYLFAKLSKRRLKQTQRQLIELRKKRPYACTPYAPEGRLTYSLLLFCYPHFPSKKHFLRSYRILADGKMHTNARILRFKALLTRFLRLWV